MRRQYVRALVCSVLSACSVTNTGNPSTDGKDTPSGINLARSALARDREPVVADADLTHFAESRREFALDLYKQLKDEGGNLFFSPYSVSAALAMTYAGAEGDTQTEMATALRFDQPAQTLHAAFNATDIALAKRITLPPMATGDGFSLKLNNAAFIQKSLAVKSPYLDLLARNYGAGIYLADFAANPERERVSINQWVSDRTAGRIDEVLPAQSVSAATVLALVNTIYFKASWEQKFDPSNTMDASFHAAGGDVTVPMMAGDYERYARLANFQMVALPYLSAGDGMYGTSPLSMLLLLPDEGQLSAVEAGLNRTVFDDAYSKLSRYVVHLRLPRFSSSVASDLAAPLQALGMVRAFGAGADFSGIAGTPGQLEVDGVLHDAFVSVDENGTEAAAATAVLVGEVSLPPSVSIAFDRPFLYFVYDQPTGEILFAGRFSAPEG